jgi:hypothetical protein
VAGGNAPYAVQLLFESGCTARTYVVGSRELLAEGLTCEAG